LLIFYDERREKKKERTREKIIKSIGTDRLPAFVCPLTPRMLSAPAACMKVYGGPFIQPLPKVA
jgi:hypothetical protein